MGRTKIRGAEAGCSEKTLGFRVVGILGAVGVSRIIIDGALYLYNLGICVRGLGFLTGTLVSVCIMLCVLISMNLNRTISRGVFHSLGWAKDCPEVCLGLCLYYTHIRKYQGVRECEEEFGSDPQY